MNTQTTRIPAVAGMFYPQAQDQLASAVSGLLAAAPAVTGAPPKVLIAPHAGYVYSGQVAAHAYRLLAGSGQQITRVILLGPAHRAYVDGMAFPSVDYFASPLGSVALDKQGVARALQLPNTAVYDDAHAFEHCLEVQLPFLQMTLESFTLVPFLVGQCPPESVAAVLDALWGGDETLIVVSSDLSHFLTYDQAVNVDSQTSHKIEAHDTHLTGEEACGAHAINGLMQCTHSRDLQVQTLCVQNSGDSAGDHDRVVGYGAYVLR